MKELDKEETSSNTEIYDVEKLEEIIKEREGK